MKAVPYGINQVINCRVAHLGFFSSARCDVIKSNRDHDQDEAARQYSLVSGRIGSFSFLRVALSSLLAASVPDVGSQVS